MCLLTYKVDVKIATEDIPCYKIVRISNENILISIVQGFEYNLGETYDNGIPDPEKVPRHITWWDGVRFDGGLFHSYSSPINRQLDKDLKEVEVKCIIPKGAYYFVGSVNLSLTEGYASSKIKIVEIIATS